MFPDPLGVHSSQLHGRQLATQQPAEPGECSARAGGIRQPPVLQLWGEVVVLLSNALRADAVI